MPSFSLSGGSDTTFSDTTPGGGVVIDFTKLDNSFNITINGVNVFIGGPTTGAPELANEVEFQSDQTQGQTVRFASDSATYGAGGISQIWQLTGTTADPLVRVIIEPDGTVSLFGARTSGGPLEPLELFNGMSVDSAAIAAAWNSSGSNTIVVDQFLTGPTNATGEIRDVICFAAGTMIETINGPVAVENLVAGDQVRTFDNAYEPVCWIGSVALNSDQLQAAPHLNPIRISANALGAGFPRQDLLVSPQHRVMVASKIVERMFGCPAVLLPAKKLLALDGVEEMTDLPHGVVYYHVLFDEHQVIWSNGLPTESLFTGPEALKTLTPEALQEIEALFPDCMQPDFAPQFARPIPAKGRQVERLLQRHKANQKPLMA